MAKTSKVDFMAQSCSSRHVAHASGKHSVKRCEKSDREARRDGGHVVSEVTQQGDHAEQRPDHAKCRRMAGHCLQDVDDLAVAFIARLCGSLQHAEHFVWLVIAQNHVETILYEAIY